MLEFIFTNYSMSEGLDATSYKQSMGAQEEDEEDRLLSVQATEEERFSDCDPVIFTCPESGKKISLKSGVFAETVRSWIRSCHL